MGVDEFLYYTRYHSDIAGFIARAKNGTQRKS